MSLQGIDVSANNVHPIDYHRVAQAGIKFAYIKLTELSNFGRYVNPYKDVDIAGFKSAGVEVAGYFFYHPDTPVTESVAFVRANSAGCYRLAVDCEIQSTTWELISMRTQQCLSLLDGRSILYSNPNFLTNMPMLPGKYPLWLAQYSHAPYRESLFWQYSQTGNVPGIRGPVDLSVYNGDVASLHTFFSPPI